MKSFKLFFAVIFFLFISAELLSQVMFVKDVNNNADIFFMPNVNTPGVIRQLTTNAGIDNHPDYYIRSAPPETLVVWSSNRDGNFEIYFSKLTGAYPTLENPFLQRYTTNNYSDRHPHLSHDGQWIIHSANSFSWTVTCPKSRCSIPVPQPCGRYEKLHLIKVGTTPIYYPVEMVGMSIVGGGTWPTIDTTFKGHPSFSPSNSKIIFSAAMDEAGSNWETYTINITFPNTVSNLTRVTQGSLYVNPPNPIQMSAGAHFTEDGNSILYSSTRTPLGNSQIFSIPAASVNVPVSPANQLTWNYGNDYVPEPTNDNRTVITSDVGVNNICAPPDSGSTPDLDIEIIDLATGQRVNLTNNDANNEMLLIGDEVSWFCGIKPNLSECTAYPKYWNVCWWKQFYRLGTEPTYLPAFPNRELYTRAFRKVADYMITHNPTYFQSIMQAMSQNWTQCDYDWMTVPSWWIVPQILDWRDTLKPHYPALIMPLNKSNVYPNKVFDWSDVPGDNLVNTYNIQIDSVPSFSVPMINVSGLSSSLYTLTATLTNGRTYYWRGGAANTYGTSWSTVWSFKFWFTGLKHIGSDIPKQFKLYYNYPNPFNPVTSFKFQVPGLSDVKIVVFDLLGREIETLVNEQLFPGTYEVSWDGTSYSSGVYYYKITAGDYTDTKKMVMIK